MPQTSLSLTPTMTKRTAFSTAASTEVGESKTAVTHRAAAVAATAAMAAAHRDAKQQQLQQTQEKFIVMRYNTYPVVVTVNTCLDIVKFKEQYRKNVPVVTTEERIVLCYFLRSAALVHADAFKRTLFHHVNHKTDSHVLSALRAIDTSRVDWPFLSSLLVLKRGTKIHGLSPHDLEARWHKWQSYIKKPLPNVVGYCILNYWKAHRNDVNTILDMFNLGADIKALFNTTPRGMSQLPPKPPQILFTTKLRRLSVHIVRWHKILDLLKADAKSMATQPDGIQTLAEFMTVQNPSAYALKFLYSEWCDRQTQMDKDFKRREWAAARAVILDNLNQLYESMVQNYTTRKHNNSHTVQLLRPGIANCGIHLTMINSHHYDMPSRLIDDGQGSECEDHYDNDNSSTDDDTSITTTATAHSSTMMEESLTQSSNTTITSTPSSPSSPSLLLDNDVLLLPLPPPPPPTLSSLTPILNLSKQLLPLSSSSSTTITTTTTSLPYEPIVLNENYHNMPRYMWQYNAPQVPEVYSSHNDWWWRPTADLLRHSPSPFTNSNL